MNTRSKKKSFILLFFSPFYVQLDGCPTRHPQTVVPLPALAVHRDATDTFSMIILLKLVTSHEKRGNLRCPRKLRDERPSLLSPPPSALALFHFRRVTSCACAAQCHTRVSSNAAASSWPWTCLLSLACRIVSGRDQIPLPPRSWRIHFGGKSKVIEIERFQRSGFAILNACYWTLVRKSLMK